MAVRDDVGALASQFHSDRPSDAARGAGHDRNAPFERVGRSS
jgi:hypothetical protein